MEELLELCRQYDVGPSTPVDPEIINLCKENGINVPEKSGDGAAVGANIGGDVSGENGSNVDNNAAGSDIPGDVGKVVGVNIAGDITGDVGGAVGEITDFGGAIEYAFVNTGGHSKEKSDAGGADINKISAAADTVDAPGKAKVFCKLCRRDMFGNQINLRRHYTACEAIKKKTEHLSIACPLCPRRFKRASSYAVHLSKCLKYERVSFWLHLLI